MRLRTDGLSWQQLDDQIVVLDLSGSNYFKLNGTAATLWSALADGADRRTLAQLLVAEHDAPADRADDDVDAFLGDLDEAGLLERDAST